MNRQNVDLGSGKVSKLLFSLALPTITSQIVNMLYNLVDRIYIGHMQPVETVGKLALTGVGVCLPIIVVISAFAALLAMGGAPRASIQEGRGNPKEAERIMGNCFTMLVMASVVLTVVLQLFARDLLLLFGASENTIDYAAAYMGIYSLGTIFVQVTLGMNAYITAQGFTTISMRTTLIGAGLNIVLDPIFIFGLGMGVRGAALATILSQAVSAARVFSRKAGVMSSSPSNSTASPASRGASASSTRQRYASAWRVSVTVYPAAPSTAEPSSAMVSVQSSRQAASSARGS